MSAETPCFVLLVIPATATATLSLGGTAVVASASFGLHSLIAVPALG
jgi:hypothetical protein